MKNNKTPFVVQAITTRVIPATNTKPARIKAECARGSLIISYPSGAGASAHRSAARLLCERFAAEDVKEYCTPYAGTTWLKPFISGVVKNGDYVHVFKA